ncbi:heterokaryon incompatibility protein-domain-containing protein, partial [Cryomyces antarcticus]
TRNSEAALRHLGSETEPRSLWVDAVCINQSDVQEHNQQVKRTWTIYRHARRVIVFLGEERNGSEKAVTLLQTPGHLPMFDKRPRHLGWSMSNYPRPGTHFRCFSEDRGGNGLESSRSMPLVCRLKLSVAAPLSLARRLGSPLKPSSDPISKQLYPNICYTSYAM